MLRKLIVTGTAVLLLAACHEPSSPAARPPEPQQVPVEGTSLWLKDAGDDKVTIEYERGKGEGPRVMELWVKVQNSSGLGEWTAGEALSHASKSLVVQDKGDGMIRVVVLSSTNTQTIGSGTIAELELERNGNDRMHAEILTDRPMFAPQEAQMGLIVGDPIEL